MSVLRVMAGVRCLEPSPSPADLRLPPGVLAKQRGCGGAEGGAVMWLQVCQARRTMGALPKLELAARSRTGCSIMTFERLLELVGREAGPAVRIDSRRVEAGDVFVAIRGTACDGHDFISQALDNGAKYIVCQENHEMPAATAAPGRCARIVVKDSRLPVSILWVYPWWPTSKTRRSVAKS